MKIWYQHGSEHSANLVMIGHFVKATDATKVIEIVNALTKQVAADHEKDMLDLLGRLNIMSIGPNELEQFLYDVSVKADGSKVILTTDEIDVSAFLKIMFDQGARIEVYSAHDHCDTDHGRGR